MKLWSSGHCTRICEVLLLLACKCNARHALHGKWKLSCYCAGETVLPVCCCQRARCFASRYLLHAFHHAVFFVEFLDHAVKITASALGLQLYVTNEAFVYSLPIHIQAAKCNVCAHYNGSKKNRTATNHGLCLILPQHTCSRRTECCSHSPLLVLCLCRVITVMCTREPFASRI